MAAKKAVKYQKTAGTEISISKLPALMIGSTVDTDFVDFGCVLKDVSINKGQKGEIDVTPMNEEFVEQKINGLSAASEVPFSVNWSGDEEAIGILDAANDSDEFHEFKITLKTGDGWVFIGQVKQADVSLPVNGVVSGSYSVRVFGKVQRLVKKTVGKV